MKTPHLYCLPPSLIFKFCPPPLSPPPAPSHFPSTSNPHATVLSVVLFLRLNGSSCHIWCATLLHNNMDLHMHSLGTLLPEGPWCVFYAFYATRHQVYWGLAHNVIFYWYSDLISHTGKHTQHTQGPVDWHTHINIYLHHLLCAYSSYNLQQKFTFPKIFHLWKSYICWLDALRLGSSCETQIILIELIEMV